MGKIFQVLESKDQQTPIIFTEGIKRAKGEGFKTEKRGIPLIKADPKYMSVNEEGGIMEWLRKWHFCDQQ